MIEYEPNVPIYLQIMHEFKRMIMSGELKPGDKVMSVRDLAIKFRVNPNTMQRALSELERDELVYSERTTGRFITQNESVILSLKKEMAAEIVNRFTATMRSIGFSNDEIIDMIREEK